MAVGHIVNGALAILLVAAGAFVLFVLPVGPMASSRHWAWLLLPAALLTCSHWALMHEAIHGLLHPHPRLNRLAGRALAIAGGSSFRLLRFGHLMHHRFNRHVMDRPDCFDPKEISPTAARSRYFLELFGGVYLIEVVVPQLFLLPRRICLQILERIYRHRDPAVQQIHEVARRTLTGRRQMRELRQDAAATAGLFAAAGLAWGPDWPLLLAFLIGRGAIVSFLDNVYHYRTPLDSRDFAFNLRLPMPLRLAILNMNLHRVHHRAPHLPWWQLPERHRATGDGYDAAFLPAALRQLRGPASIRSDCFATANVLEQAAE